MRTGFVHAAVFWSLLGATAAVPAAAGTPFDLKAGKARVILQVARPPEGKPYANVGGLVGGLFDPESKGNKITPFSGWLQFQAVDDPVTGLRWLVGQVLPGDIAFYDVDVPGLGACFNGGTVTFKVEAGKTYFAGVFDPKPYVVMLNTDLMTHPRYMTRNSPPVYLYDLKLEHYTAPQDVPDAAAQVAALFSDLQQPAANVEMAQVSPTTFNTGFDAFRTAKLCRGYYSAKSGEASSSSAASSSSSQ